MSLLRLEFKGGLWSGILSEVKPERLEKLFGQGRCRDGVFVTTQWSVVMAAAAKGSGEAEAALAELCAAYWYPLYAFARRLGQAPEDAQDSVQGFFARVLQSSWLDGASPERGKFRSWLLACFKHHLADARARAGAQKRGAGLALVSLEAFDPEGRFAQDALESRSCIPESLYDRRWALTVLEQVLAKLRAEHERTGKAALFAVLEQTLPGGSASLPYSEIGRRLEMSEGAARVAVHRLRDRYRQVLRQEIARTVQSPDQIDEEIRYLMRVLAPDA